MRSSTSRRSWRSNSAIRFARSVLSALAGVEEERLLVADVGALAALHQQVADASSIDPKDSSRR